MALRRVLDLAPRLPAQEGAQSPQATDAEHDLLANTCVLVTAVQMASDPAVVLAILREVGIEQVQRHLADLGAPHACVDGAAWERYGDSDGRAVWPQHGQQRRMVVVEPVVRFALVAGVIDDLTEIPVAIQQTDGNQWQTEVTCSLQMIAGQHTQATRVDGQRLSDGELS